MHRHRCTSNTRAHPRPGSIGAAHDPRPGTLDIAGWTPRRPAVDRPRSRTRRRSARCDRDRLDHSGSGGAPRPGPGARRPGLGSSTRLPISIVEATVEHDPQLVAEPMVVRPGIAAGHDRDEPGGRGLVERIGLRARPRAGRRSRDALGDETEQADHLDRGQRRLPTLVAVGAAGPRLAPARDRRWRAPRRCTGTPVVRATSAIPRAASFGDRSKWAVSPRITAPRQITASISPRNASAERPAGSRTRRAPTPP